MVRPVAVSPSPSSTRRLDLTKTAFWSRKGDGARTNPSPGYENVTMPVSRTGAPCAASAAGMFRTSANPVTVSA